MKVKEESEKAGLKLNIQKTKIMSSSPISSWQIDGETMQTVRDIIFLGFKITADGDGSHEIKKRFLLGRKAMTNLDSILKSRDITLPTKVCLVKVMVFPVVMNGCESWTTKKAECWRMDAFGTVVLEKTLESPLYCKEIKPINPNGNQSWIFIGRTDAEAETPILRPLDVKNWLLGKDSEAGKDWRQEEKGMTRGWDSWMASWIWASSRSWWWTGNPGMLQSMGLQRIKHDRATELNLKFYLNTWFPCWLLYFKPLAASSMLYLGMGQ